MVARLREQRVGVLEQPLGSVDEFDFPFPPGGLLLRLQQGSRVHPVIAEVSQGGPVGCKEAPDGAPGLQLGYRDHVLIPCVDLNESSQPPGHRFRVLAQPHGEFPTFPNRDGKLQVPSVVVSAGPPAERDPAGRQCQAGGIEVDGVKRFVLGCLHPVHPRQRLQNRQLVALADVVLSLHFEHLGVGHGTA